jgi:hypothetical protein
MKMTASRKLQRHHGVRAASMESIQDASFSPSSRSSHHSFEMIPQSSHVIPSRSASQTPEYFAEVLLFVVIGSTVLYRKARGAQLNIEALELVAAGP